MKKGRSEKEYFVKTPSFNFCFRVCAAQQTAKAFQMPSVHHTTVILTANDERSSSQVINRPHSFVGWLHKTQ